MDKLFESFHTCSPAHADTSVIITETRMAGLQWTHISYVKCTECERIGKVFSGPGYCDIKTICQAIESWNEEFYPYYHGKPENNLKNE